MSDDWDLFAQQMSDVRRIQPEVRVDLSRASALDKQTLLIRRTAAQALRERDDNPLTDSQVPPVHPTDVIGFCRDGVAHGVYRNLRLGKYEQQARLDLHRLTVNQARDELFRFVRDCQKYDVRTAIVLPGKGERGPEKAVLKSYVAFWLQHLQEVLAFHSALPRHGGAGALYVLMKKSEAEKTRNREKYLGTR